jgi:hypothetical protein
MAAFGTDVLAATVDRNLTKNFGTTKSAAIEKETAKYLVNFAVLDG